MIKVRDLEFEYFDRDEEGYLTDMINAIRGINFDAQKGQIISIVGKNGSGKSTFARILNRLLVSSDGEVTIDGLDANDSDNDIEIRKRVGMVFQNPDNQLIGSIVAEDVAFGAENLGVPQKELRKRVIDCIIKVGLADDAKSAEEFSLRRVNELSGGEKQKVAIASVLAMDTECLVLDEATSMLDPKSRRDLLETIKRLNEEHKITVIMITHIMEELFYSDMVYVMYNGRMVKKGRPEAIFADKDKLKEWGLDVPDIIEIRDLLYKRGIIKDRYLCTLEGIVSRIKKEHAKNFYLDTKYQGIRVTHEKTDPVNAILVDKLNASYGKKKILEDVSLAIKMGEYVVVMGETGSGKSTLLQHLPALIKAKKECIYVDGIDVNDKATDLSKLRCKIGYLFQYPEEQLFSKNAYEDVVFGPRNLGISEVEAEKRAYESISLVGLSEDIYDMPIFKLSGGQKKRLALAGILAMKPKYLILDEPLAGLDPEGREDMLKIIDILHKDAGITIIMVCHNIDDVAEHAESLVVIDKGKIIDKGHTTEVFYRTAIKSIDEKRDIRYEDIPTIMKLLIMLRGEGLPVDCLTSSVEKGIQNISEVLLC